MKSLSVKALVLMATVALGFASCKKQSDDQKLKAPETTAAADFVSKDGALLAELFRKVGPQSEFFTVQAEGQTRLVTKKKVTYTIPSLAFVKPDGSTATGVISLSIKEIFEPKDFVFADKQTASGANILQSFGEFFVRATQGTTELKLRPGVTIGVQAPAVGRPAGQEKLPLWDGDTSATTTLNGYNQFNQPVSVSVPVAVAPGIDWSQLPTYALFNSTTGTVDFQLSELLRWTNCDVLYSTPNPKTTVLGYFSNYFNDETQQSLSEQPSLLYFKPQGINSVVKLYNLILGAPAGYKGFLSYQAAVSIGQKGSFLAITALNGKFYAQLLPNVTVAAPAAGTNYSPIKFTLVEVSATDLVNLITTLNTL